MYPSICKVNELWGYVQERASTKQGILERCVQEQAQNLESSQQQEIIAFTENFSFLRSLYLTPACDEDGVCGRRKDQFGLEEGRDEVEEFYDEDLKNQIELHELFEELASVEESAVTEEVVNSDLTSCQEQLTRLQVSVCECSVCGWVTTEMRVLIR